MQKPTKLQKKLWISLTFLLKFIVFAIPLHLILWVNLDTTPIQAVTAKNTYDILRLFGQDVVLNGMFLYTNTYAFEFVRDCTAWKSILAFAALVFATPFVSWRSRAFALLLGIPAIYGINLIRTATTAYIGIINPSALEIVHTFLWREGLIAIILVMWYLWFRKFRDYKIADYRILENIIEKINLRQSA